MKEQVIDTDGQLLYKYTEEDGTIIYINPESASGEAHHRIGGPAYIGADGYIEYQVKGKFHRTDGPARIWPEGTLEYWIEGKRHRLDGFAVFEPRGRVYVEVRGKKQLISCSSYFIEGVYYTKDEYPQAVLEYKLKQLVG